MKNNNLSQFLKVMGLILYISILAAGCDHDHDRHHEDSWYHDVILPLHLGNTWTFFSRVEISTRGALEIIEGTYTMQVVDQVDLMGDYVYDFRELGTNTGEYYLNYAEGCYRYGYYNGFNTRIYNPPVLAYRYPGNPSPYFDEYGMRIVSTDTVIRTVAGTFHCYVYEHQPMYQGEFFLECLAPNYGHVSFELMYTEYDGHDYVTYYIQEHLAGYDLYGSQWASTGNVPAKAQEKRLSEDEIRMLSSIKQKGMNRFP